MRPLTYVALLILVTIHAASAASSPEWSAYSTARVDTLVERFRTSATPYSVPWVPSLSIAIGIDGNLAFAKGYGEARPGYTATEHSVYHIGSVTKQFTAAAMLGLIDDGALAPLTGAPITLDLPVRDFFDGVENWVAADHPPITIRGLLTMTSALPNFTSNPPATVDPWGTITADRILKELKKLPTARRAPTFEYSNSNYFLLAQAMEAVAPNGSPNYRSLLRSGVIDKVGLKDTGFIDDYAPGTALAVATPSWGPNTPVSRKRPAFAEADWFKGSADMASSAFDLFSWNKALMEGRVVRPSSREAMFSDAARAGPSRYYGMGWFIEHAEGADMFSHTGYVPGFSALNMIVRVPGGSWISVSLLVNGDGVEGLEKLASKVVNIALH